jgi:hypothetical protein
VLAGVRSIDLDVWGAAAQSIELRRSAPNRSTLIDEHSSRITELKSVLKIKEIDIPCVHFLFTDSKRSLRLHLPKNTFSLYGWFRELLYEWENIFEAIEEREALADQQNVRLRDDRENRNRNSGPARHQMKRLVELIDAEPDGGLRTTAVQLAEIIGKISKDAGLRTTAFLKLRALKQDHPALSKELISAFNSMIDQAGQLEERVMPMNAQEEIDYSVFDERLYRALERHLLRSAPRREEDHFDEDVSVSKIHGRKLRAFISYSRFDGENSTDGINFLAEFKQHLAPLVKFGGPLEIWDDTLLKAGEDWDDSIKLAMRSCDLIFLLISHHFLNTRYITETELAIAIERQKKKECIVVPIVLRSCGFGDIPMLRNLSALPRKGHSIASWRRNGQWSSRDDAWVEVYNGVKELLGG